MSTEVLTQTVGAGGKATFGAGTVFVIIAAPSGVLNITARSVGNSNKNRVFTGVPAGFKFTADSPNDGFDTLEVVSAAAQTISLAVGNDDVSYSNSVSVANTVTTQALPAGTVTDLAPINPTIAGQHALVPVNAARRRVTVFSDPRNVADVFVWLRKTAGGQDLGMIQPGQYLTFEGTYGIDYRAANGGDGLYIFEES